MLVGDVVGRTGRRAFRTHTPRLRAEQKIDVVIVNGENAAGGKGYTRKALDELYAGGADIVTSGNHVWDKKEVFSFIEDEPFLVRPANYPDGTPGQGYCIFPLKAHSIAVINLSGRSFMPPLDCPFQKMEEILCAVEGKADFVILDFHAETTSEKLAMGHYLDGRIDIVVGTHTREEMEHRDPQLAGKDRQTVHRQQIIDAYGAQEGALACHVRTRDDIILMVEDIEVICHSLLAEERMIKPFRFINHPVVPADFSLHRPVFIQPVVTH